MKALAALLMLTGTAQADDLQRLTFTNHTDLTVSGFSVFEERPDGTIIDDNLGAWINPVPPGATATLDLALIACRNLRVYVTFAEGAAVPGGENFDAAVDLCADPSLILTD
jgi:hypothetical protein